jgi:hypothetical protein
VEEYTNIELTNHGVAINFDYLWLIDDLVEVESRLFHLKNQSFVEGMSIRTYLLGYTAYNLCIPTQLEAIHEPKEISSIEVG